MERTKYFVGSHISKAEEIHEEERSGRKAVTVVIMTPGIFRQVEKLNTPLSEKWRKAAICISFSSIIVNLALAVVYFVLSFTILSPAAFGFAFEVILDCISSIVVLWRFLGKEGHLYSYDKERRASLGIGICFVLSSFAISAKAIHTLIDDTEPRRSESLLILSAATFVVLFIAAYLKYVVAYKVDSYSMRVDAFNTTAGGIMAFAVLIASVLYEHSKAIWFLDATVALCIAFIFLAYGIRMIVEMCRYKGTPVPTD